MLKTLPGYKDGKSPNNHGIFLKFDIKMFQSKEKNITYLS